MISRAVNTLLLSIVTQGCATESALERMISDGRYEMGTVLEITLEGLEPQPAAKALDDLYEVATRLDRLFSIYRPESDISRLNRTAGRGRQPVDSEVEEILERSIVYSELTRGAFDVTIGPLVDLWLLAAERDAPPAASELAAARQRVGADRISVVSGEGVSLGEAGMKLDLGGIAKGYALDRMLPLLERHGIESALLNFGQSSSWAVGAPAGSPGWRLLINGPEGRFAGLITLRDQALSVSGSQGQSVEIGGRRYGHIIDPRSGEPLMRVRQAVVVSKRAALAEALSLALLVLDADAGLALVAAEPDCEALLIDGGGALRSTSGWEAAVRFEPLSAPGEERKGPESAPRGSALGAAQALPETLRSHGHGNGRAQLSDL